MPDPVPPDVTTPAAFAGVPADDLARYLGEVTRLTGIGIFDHDHVTDVIYWSPGQRAIYGLTADEPVTLAGFLAQVHDEDRARIGAAVARAHDPSGDGRFDVVHRIRRRDGQPRWIATRSQTYFADGRPLRTIGAVIDVTARRFVFDAGAETTTDDAARLWGVLDRSLNEIYLFDAVSLRLEHANAGALRNLGFDLDHLRQLTMLDLVPAFTEASFRGLVAPLLAGHVEKLQIDSALRRADGSSYPVEIVLQLVDHDGARVFLAVVNDVAARRDLDLALRMRERALATALHPVAITDLVGTVVYVNPAFVRLWGYTDAAEIVGRHNGEFTAPGALDAIVPNLLRDGSWQGELAAVHRDGHGFTVQVGATVLRDPDGTVTHMVGSFMDVSERNRAAAALRASLDEKDALLKEVHHRVKNNLQVVTSLLALQAQRDGRPDVVAALSDTQARVRAMAVLHETLYRSANLAQVSLASYLQEICRHLERTHGGGRVRIRIDADDLALPLELAMPCGLIVSEAIANALKHAFPGDRRGVVTVGARRATDGEVALAIRDDGVGLPAALVPGTGDGLGLRLIERLASQLGGEARFDRDGGTVVAVRFRPAAGDGPRP